MSYFSRVFIGFNKGIKTAQSRYINALHNRPVITKAFTSGTLYFISDTISQQIENLSKPKDERLSFQFGRSARMAIFGFFATGPIFHYWYHILDTTFPKKKFAHIIIKTALDQIVCAPIFDAFFFAGMGVLEGKNFTQIKEKIQKDWLTTYLVDCAFTSEDGVLVNLFESKSYQEIDYRELELFDRTFYLTDTVQKIGSSSSNLILGRVICHSKKHYIRTFKSVREDPTKKNVSLDDLIVRDQVKDSSSFIKFTNVLSNDKLVAGEVIKFFCTLEVEMPDGKIVTYKSPNTKHFKVEGIYNDYIYCKDKTVIINNKTKAVIRKVIPLEAEVDWYFFLTSDDEMPPKKQLVENLSLFNDDYKNFVVGESILFTNDEGEEEGGYIYLTKTTAKIIWQDGTETNEETTDLIYADCLATDYFPGDIVCTPGFNAENPYKDDQKRWGVIKSFNPDQRTSTICWNNVNHFESTFLKPEYENSNTYIEQNVSVYDLEYLDDYNFDQSDYVCRVEDDKVNNQENTDQVLGQIIGFEDCKLIVKWNNNEIEQLYPFELCMVTNDEDDDEIESDQEQEVSQLKKQVSDLEHIKNELKDFSSRITNLFSSLVNGITNGNSKESTRNNSNNSTPSTPMSNNSNTTTTSGDNNNLDENGDPLNNSNNSIDSSSVSSVGSGSTPERKSNFEILTTIEVHNFLTDQIVINKKMMTAIQKEFDILMTSLPDGIYVKAFSDKIHLLQALIIGPSETVYENSIFIFDICLPSGYPSIPPKVHFHSVSFKLNPNLYENGNVCLSLLGTWHGNKSENWIPNTSNLLQVLISIQGLILGCKEPYYLEAGFETQIGTRIGIRNSILYNEDAYLLSLESLLHYMKHRPAVFEDILVNHIATKKQDILKRIDQFLHFKEGDNDTIFEIKLPPSEGFLSPLRKLKLKIESMP
eukprot:gene1473-1858_t